MYLSLLSIFSALAAVSLAANPNPFDIPPQGLSFTAGQPTTLKWTPTTSGTVTLRLRQGASSDLEAGTVIQGISAHFVLHPTFSILCLISKAD